MSLRRVVILLALVLFLALAGLLLLLVARAWYLDVFKPREKGNVRGFVMENAKPRQIAEWSPDGSHIVFTISSVFTDASYETYEHDSIYVVRADGTGLRRISEGVGQDELEISPDISPDGARLVYATTRHKELGPGLFVERIYRNFEIETSALDGSDRRRLTETSYLEHDVAPAWSPSGDRIAFVKEGHVAQVERGIYVMAADGSGVRRIVAFRVADLEVGQFETDVFHRAGPAWSPDGAMLAYVVDGITQAPGEGGEPGTNFRKDFLYTVRADGSELTLVAASGGGSSRYWISAPGWSPDGQRLAFSMRDEEGVGLYTVRPDGTDLRQVLARYAATYASWSPDGSKILFGAYVVRPDGSGLRQLGLAGYGRPTESFQSWSPDGSRIAVLEPGRVLYTVAPDGRDKRMLVRRWPDGQFRAENPG